MDLNKLKIGDFITMWDEDGDIAVGRITGFERYQPSSSEKAFQQFKNRICGVYAIIFPYWKETDLGSCANYARISPYYAEKADYSSEAEVMAWFQAADRYEKELRADADRVNKCISRNVVRKRIVPMDKINKWEYPRRPPRGCINWVWSILKDFKIWDPKKNTVKIFGKTVWEYTPKKG